jgi:hypothetical protein
MFTRTPSPVAVALAVALASALAVIQCGGSSSTTPTTPTTPTLTVTAVSLNPTTVTAGSTAQGTVTLSTNAGATVTLSSSNTGVATVPASVNVAAGSTTATFTVTAVAAGSATIAASVNGSTQNATVTVTGTVQANLLLSLSVTTVVGGNSITGSVAVSPPAPAGGAVVQLQWTDPVVAPTPTSVTIPAGQTAAQFTINTRASGGTIPTTITASFNGQTSSAALSVTPVVPAESLDSISLNPASVSAGSSSQGTATLNMPAGSGGAVVTLQSSNGAAASVPGSITIPAGSTSGTFTVTTSAVSAVTMVTISGTRNATQSAVLTVNPVSNVPVASFTVSGPGGADTCRLLASFTFDCVFDGSASRPSSGATVSEWNWTYTVSAAHSESSSSPTLTPKPGNCDIFPPSVPSTTNQLQMTVTLTVHDTAGRDSALFTDNNVRVLRSGNACGF